MCLAHQSGDTWAWSVIWPSGRGEDALSPQPQDLPLPATRPIFVRQWTNSDNTEFEIVNRLDGVPAIHDSVAYAQYVDECFIRPPFLAQRTAFLLILFSLFLYPVPKKSCRLIPGSSDTQPQVHAYSQLSASVYVPHCLPLQRCRRHCQQYVRGVSIGILADYLESYEIVTPVLSKTKPLIESADGLAVAT